MHRDDGEAKRDESGGIVGRGGITLGGSVVGGTVLIVCEILAARFLGVRLYGCYALGFVFAKVCETASMFGLRLAVLHFIPIYRSEGRPGHLAGAIISSLVLPLILSAGLIALTWVLAPWLANTVLDEPDALPYIRLLAFAIPFAGLSDVLGHITRAFGHAVHYVVIRNLVAPIAYLAFLAVLLVTAAAPEWIAAAFGGAYALAFLVGLLLVARVAGVSTWRTKPTFPLRDLYGYSFPIVVNAMLYLVLGATDIVMLGAFRTAEEAGLYRGALQFAIVFQTIIVAFNAATAYLYPVFIKERRQDDLDRAYATTTRWITVFAVPAFVLIMLNRSDLLSLLGPEFTVAATALAILLAGHLLRSCAGGAAILLVVSGHQKLETLDAVVGVTVNVVLNLVLIPRYGIVGAAVAMTAAHLVMNAMRIRQVGRTLHLATLRPDLARLLAMAAIVGGGSLGVTFLLGIEDGSGIAWLLVRVPITGLILAAGAWHFGLSSQDRALLRSTIARRRRA